MKPKVLEDLPVSIAVAVCVTAAALAANAGLKDRFPIDLAELQAKAEERFDAADADGDGLLSADEFAAADLREAFAYRRYRRHDRRGEQARVEGQDEQREDVFAAADADGDAQLSKDEFDALPAAARAVRQRRLFERLDANQDGMLTPAEFPSRASRLAALDVNGDGQITRDEMPRRRPRHR